MYNQMMIRGAAFAVVLIGASASYSQVPQTATPQSAAVPAAATTSIQPADTYTAKAGDTLSQLAIGLLGEDSKANRDLVVSANPSLQANPDLVVEGQKYTRTASVTVVPAAAVEAPVVSAKPVEADPKLKYTAKPGDTVNNLAGALLGGETKTNREAIVNANASLQSDADHIVAGKTYTIPAPDGLSATTKPAPTIISFPTTRPDADQIIEAGATRNLRYIAKAGDTVTSLAVALLGGDSKANRDAIININPSLKADPDTIVAGQTYWIPAPVAEVQESH